MANGYSSYPIGLWLCRHCDEYWPRFPGEEKNKFDLCPRCWCKMDFIELGENDLYGEFFHEEEEFCNWEYWSEVND